MSVASVINGHVVPYPYTPAWITIFPLNVMMSNCAVVTNAGVCLATWSQYTQDNDALPKALVLKYKIYIIYIYYIY